MHLKFYGQIYNIHGCRPCIISRKWVSNVNFQPKKVLLFFLPFLFIFENIDCWFNWRPIQSCCTWKHISNHLICLYKSTHSLCLFCALCLLGYFTNYTIIVLLKMFIYFSLFCNDFPACMISVYLRNLSVQLLWHNEISFPLGLIYLDCMCTHVLSIHLILNSGICSEWDRTISKTDIAV